MRAELVERPFTPLDTSSERLEQVLSPVVGIVNGTARHTYGTTDSRLVHVVCRVSSTKRVLGAATPDFSGCAHPSAARARVAALAEAVERYSAAYVPGSGLRRSTAAELGGAAVAPERFALFDPRQRTSDFPFHPFEARTPLCFTEGFALEDGRGVFLPAQLVFLARPAADLVPIGYATSNGLAAGPTLEEAILSGLLELIERDVFMIAWKNRLSLPHLDWSADDALRALDERYFAPSRLAYTVLDGSAFFAVPVALAIVHGPAGEQTALAVGGGAASTVAEAWLKALSEAFAVRRWLTEETFEDPARRCEHPDDVRTFDDHMLFYAEHERAASAGFLVASGQRVPTCTVPSLTGETPLAQIAELTARLGARSTSAYAVDVTSPDIAALELRVARVIAPELCPLDVAHIHRYLGGTRLSRAAVEAGLSEGECAFEELNPLPHPFP